MKWYAILLGAAIGVLGGIAVGYFLIPHLMPKADGQSQPLEGATLKQGSSAISTLAPVARGALS